MIMIIIDAVDIEDAFNRNSVDDAWHEKNKIGEVFKQMRVWKAAFIIPNVSTWVTIIYSPTVMNLMLYNSSQDINAVLCMNKQQQQAVKYES